MKTMTREEAILAMVINKQEVTSDEFTCPDKTYCFYDDTKELPFRYRNKNGYEEQIVSFWNTKVWRLRKYIPKDKELVWAWYDNDISITYLRYYDAKNNNTFDSFGARDGIIYDNYAPFDGTPPPNICSIEELED